MNLDILLDPLFRTPFMVGLVVSIVLPLTGVLLRLRDEWLAALGLAHLADAEALIAALPDLDDVSFFTISVQGRQAAGSMDADGFYEDSLAVSVFLRNNDQNALN